MTFTSNYQENLTAELNERVVEPAASVHVEDAPCVVIRAVKMKELYAAWRPRTTARLVDLSHERTIQPTILFDAALRAG